MTSPACHGRWRRMCRRCRAAPAKAAGWRQRTMTMANETPVDDLDFETALRELEEIVNRLESGRVDLKASIAIYERGEALKIHCEALLRDAEARIERITLSREGRPTGTEPLDGT